MDPTDEKERAKFIAEVDINTSNRLLEAQAAGIKENVCKAIEQPQFVPKPQVDCFEGEVSIDNLSKTAIWSVWRRSRVLAGLPDPGDAIPEFLEDSE